MTRRTFLHGSLHAAWLAQLAARATLAQAPVPRQLVLDVNSRSLQWLRSADEVAKATIEIACGGVCVHVGAAPAHVDPARVAQQLPAFVNQVRARGLKVTQIKGPAITDASEPNTETIVAAAAQAGITHYSLGGYAYDLKKPLGPQLEAIKPRLERFVRLNERHRIKLVYDTASGAASVGGVILDLLPVMKMFDPRYIGFRWDTGNMALHGDGMWEPLIRLAGPYVAAVAWRDRGWTQDLGLLGEGGPYAGPAPRVEPLVTQPDGSAIPGTPGAAGAGGRAGGGRAGRAGGRGAAPGDAPPEGGRAAGGRGGGPANSAGAGSIDAANPLYRSLDGEMPKRPIGGKNVKGAGWSAPSVPMGTGIVHIPRLVTVLSEIGFNGPCDLQSEYAGMGGAETGADTLTLPRQFILGLLKRDVLTIRKSFEMANAGLAI